MADADEWIAAMLLDAFTATATAKRGRGAGKTDSKESVEEREAFHVASGRMLTGKVARDEGLREKLLSVISHWREAQDLGEGPFYEYGWTTTTAKGISEATGGGRTPHVFEEQLSWPLHNQRREPGLRWVPNYSSVGEHAELATVKFEEDISEGMMERMTLGDFKAR